MKLLSIAAALALTGCMQYGDYYRSVDAANAKQVEAQRAYAEAEAIRYQALMRIAESGDATTKVAAAMALAFAQLQQAPSRMAVPAQPQNEALQWASVLAPVLTQGLVLKYNTRLNMRQSDNATALGINTNQTFGVLAAEASKPPVVVTQPAPVVVEPRDPVIVTQPPPVIVDPVIVPPTDPIIVPPTIVDPVIVDPVVIQPTITE